MEYNLVVPHTVIRQAVQAEAFIPLHPVIRLWLGGLETIDLGVAP